MMLEKRVHLVARNSLARAWRFLVRMDVAAILIVIVLLVAALGSCFPYLSPVIAADPHQLARWDASIRARYGGLTDWLLASGAFRWSSSVAFLVPLVLLTTSTLVCTLDRWRRVWRRVFQRPVRCPDSVFDAAPYTARLVASSAATLTPIAQARLERRGFRVRSEAAGSVVYLRGDRNWLAPLATLLIHLAMLLLLLGAVLSNWSGWREELTVGPDAAITVGHGSGLALRHAGFAIVRYPDGNVASYDAQIAVFKDGKPVARRSVRVNEPLVYDGIGFYLQGFEEAEGGYSVTLLAAHDPGYGLVIAAGFLLLLGLAVIFNFPSCSVRAQIGPDGTLRLAGEAERNACDFESEFGALVQEIRDAIPTHPRGLRQ